MNKYELALVVSAKVEDEVRDAVVEKAKGYITRYNGTITEVEEWGKKKLAYEIQKMSEAYYYFIHFDTDNTDCPNEIEDQIRIMENVIRYLCVKVEAYAQCPAEVERHVRIMDNVLRYLVVKKDA